MFPSESSRPPCSKPILSPPCKGLQRLWKRVSAQMMVESEATTGFDDAKSCNRGHWRPGEDEKLRQLVQQCGPQNWNSIAEKLEGRSGL